MDITYVCIIICVTKKKLKNKCIEGGGHTYKPKLQGTERKVT